MYAAAFEYDLNLSMDCCRGVERGEGYLKRFVMTVYAAGPLGLLVAYFILRVEVSFGRVVMTLF